MSHMATMSPLFGLKSLSLHHQSKERSIMEVKRICIYPKDIERITGKSNRSSQRLLAQIRNHCQKSEKQLVSVEEFCRFTGLDIEHVKLYITG